MLTTAVIPAERALASESRNPVLTARSLFTTKVQPRPSGGSPPADHAKQYGRDYWIPALALKRRSDGMTPEEICTYHYDLVLKRRAVAKCALAYSRVQQLFDANAVGIGSCILSDIPNTRAPLARGKHQINSEIKKKCSLEILVSKLEQASTVETIPCLHIAIAY